ncbi:MAG: choline BCCT transporter BetT [Pseudomonadota bacterium]|uniref:Choline transporter n=1 Tax=Methylophaga thalassica TaxID=40223 RepID=A0ABQ5TUE9_9GAMM|nr:MULTISPECIES: choline BCCT transporter BetT [Methylophaga]MEC9413875.1 choline BCCT transporter BetT [Pseudomonadota bacterium]GLP99609.1 choline transporter [Methylophaga thalassica]
MTSPTIENKTTRKAEINPPVFFGSAILIIAFVIFAAFFSDTASSVFTATQSWIVNTFGWFYLLAVGFFLIFSIGLAMSSYGAIKLGPDHSEPDYGYLSWFAMLFSAGMGIGLLFFGVAEPIMHFSSPPVGQGGDIEAAREAMSITFFHWGLHAWAIYAVVGLSLAYFGFRHNLPLSIRSSLYPLIGERIYGPIGHTVDIFAVLGTMFGVATSLGLGVLQVNAGLTYMFGLPAESVGLQIGLIAGITLLATISVVAGLDSGIKRLSEINLGLAILLLLFVLFAGPTLFLLQTLVQNTGNYLSEVVNKTFNLYAYDPNGWIGGWTLFYWGWWIAWSPFVGMFIARVSRGRTIRQFILGVLFVPVGFTFMWMTFFGGTAIHMELGNLAGVISGAVSENSAIAVFSMFEHMPLSMISSGLATILVITFFVTSSDSGSLVIDMITSNGHPKPPVWQRIFWALTEGCVAAALLLAGGLKALQTASIAGALPFVVIMLLMCFGLMKGLRMEGIKRLIIGVPQTPVSTGRQVGWKQRLKNLSEYPDKATMQTFLNDVVKPALKKVAAELRNTGVESEIVSKKDSIELNVSYGGEKDFVYGVHSVRHVMPSFALDALDDDDETKRYYRGEVYLAEGSQHYDMYGYNQEQVIDDILIQYEKHMHFLHIVGDG